MPHFSHDGLNFSYRESGAGIPFVFQHGLGASVNQPFDIFKPPVGIRLVAFDCRGHGETEPLGNPEKITLNMFADDLMAFLDALGIQRAIIGGISMGAAVALNFALRYPDRVVGLVLSRPAWLDGPNPWNVKMFSLVARLIREHGPQHGKELFHQTPEYLETAEQYPDTARSLCGQFDTPRAHANAINLERIPLDTPSADRAEWKAIRVPALILANRHDPIHPFEYGEILSGTIPGAEFHEITAKSNSVKQHNDDVQRCIETFLREHY